MKKIKKQSKTTQKKVQEPIGIRIAKTVYSAKRISERIFGFIQYDINFVKATYLGKTQRPAKITAIEKGIVGILIVDETASFERIGAILGLDVINDKAEKAILRSAIVTLQSFCAIEGDDSCLALTDAGRTYAEKGERPDTYSKNFDVYIDSKHPNWLNIKNCIGENGIFISEINTPCDNPNLDLDKIKAYAELQAQDVHCPQNRYLLESAVWNEGHEASYKVYVCFVQNVATADVRTFVFDEHLNGLNELIAEYINTDEALKTELLANCIRLECENSDTTLLEGEAVEEAKQAVSDELIEAEKQIILEEQEEQGLLAKQEDVVCTPIGTTRSTAKPVDINRLHKKALYDSISFEVELQKIFNEDDPDEIWLISPWIRKGAFMHDRGPLIENFLKNENKRVFIAYSEPAENNDGKSMIDVEVEPGIKQLEEQYSNFYYVQLPEFHLKNVIEVKGEQKILFSGSFNVLSFSVSEHQTHIRREEMALAHHTVAKNKYQDCLIEFAEIYAKRIKEQVDNLDDASVAEYQNDRLDYFLGSNIPEIQKLFLPIEELLEEKILSNTKKNLEQKLTKIGQELVAAANMSGLTPKDKKRIENLLSSIENEMNANSVDDPSMLEMLGNNKELLGKTREKKIFPGRPTLRQNTTKEYTTRPVTTSSYILDEDIEATAEALSLYLAKLSQAFMNQEVRKNPMNTKLLNIVLDEELYPLLDLLLIAPSKNKDNAFDLSIGVNGFMFRYPTLFNGQNDFEAKQKRASQRLTMVNKTNIESVVKQLS